MQTVIFTNEASKITKNHSNWPYFTLALFHNSAIIVLEVFNGGAGTSDCVAPHITAITKLKTESVVVGTEQSHEEPHSGHLEISCS
jgi:hypothetical protein